MQAQTLGGAFVLELQASYVSTVETFPLTFTNLGTTAVNTLTLRPATGATNLSISSSNTTAATVDLNGAQFVTLDGRPGGTGSNAGSGGGAASQLTIANTSTSGVALRFINEATGNVVEYMTAQGVNTNTTSGTVVFSTTTGANGNDNNIIDHCDIRDGASTPANGVYALGLNTTTARNNSGNTISNCNIFNFYRSTAVDTAGVRLEGGNTDWSLIGNSFYQTASRAAASANVRAIYINNTSGSNFTVTGNFIGGDSPNAAVTTQKWTTTGVASAYLFQGVRLSVSTSVASSVQNNVIRNISWTTNSSASTLPGIWSGIYLLAGKVNIGTVTGNTIGSGTGTGSVSVTTSGTGGTTFGISSSSSSTVAIGNNTVGSLTANGSSTSVSASLIGIQVSDGANTISNNLVGSAATPSPLTANLNSLNAATSSTSATAQHVTGILSSSSNSTGVTGNTVANLNNNYTASAVTTGQIRGIVTSAGTNTITGNTVRNLSTTSQSFSTTTAASVLGISQSSTTAVQTVSQNIVHSLVNTASFEAVTVIGIYYTGSTTISPQLISRNLVHSLVITSTGSPRQYGMYLDAGTFTAKNNMVRMGLDASGASTSSTSFLFGIYDAAATLERNFYHNSVYVGGTKNSLDTVYSFAFYSLGTDNVRDFRNNIFFNARSNISGSSSIHSAVYYNSSGINPTGLTSNNNLFFVSADAAHGGVLCVNAGTNQTTLTSWQAATGQDASSGVANPVFVNPTGDATTVNLHLQASNPIEGLGVLIASVTDDFDGQTRSGLTAVDIGADAGNFTFLDNIAPSVSYPLLSSGTTANRTLSGWASILDTVFGPGTGTIASGANAPRLYYKKSTDADVFNVANNSTGNGWKYVTGTSSGGSFSFTINYSIINGGSVSVGDSVQYFVVAQDVANNFISSPAGATASATINPVQNINGKPSASVNSFSIVASFSGGTVTVGGASGSYSSLSGAGGLFAALNSRALTSDLSVSITGDTSEDGSSALNAISANNYPAATVTVRPDSATMRTIVGSFGGSGLIRLSGVQFLTIDGSFGGNGRYLTFRNTSNTSATMLFVDDASNNAVLNCVIEGGATSGAVGVVYFSTGVITGNNNNIVTGNQIRDLSTAVGVPSNLIYSYGNSSNNTISNNDIFNFTSYGVYAATGTSWNVTGNNVYQAAARTGILIGIYLNGSGMNIRGNTVHDLTASFAAYGIYISAQTGTTSVVGNRLWNIGNTSGSTGVVYGFYLDSSGGVQNKVTLLNNMVAISSSGTTAQNLYGISDQGTGGTTTIIGNTVLLTGTGSAGKDTWAYAARGYSAATVKNNIFLNLRTGGGNHFAANRLPSSTGTLTMDYNVYAGTGQTTAANIFDSSSGLGSTGTPISYTQWQTNVPSDTHSKAGNPGGNYTSAMFVDPTTADLHVVPAGNVLVANTGIPIAGVTTDYDGQTRGLIAPDIGADEFDFANASLSALTLSSGILNPSFDPNILIYNATVANATTSVIAAPMKLDPNANATVNGGNVATPVALNVGTNAINIAVIAQDGATTKTYTITTTRLTAVESWRQSKFNATSNSGNAADDADPNGNGISNLLEYALNGDPTGNSTGKGILPQAASDGTNHLQVAFSRYLDRSDLTLTVQANDTLMGTWTDLAQSVNGGAFTLINGSATVSETGTGNTRSVTVGDIYTVTDPAHPRRFMRLQVTRP